MFQEYKIGKIYPFKEEAILACIHSAGVLVTVSRKRITISHLEGCEEEIELTKYLRDQINLKFKWCHGVKQISNHSQTMTNGKSCCFGLILDSNLWCLILSVSNSEKKNLKRLQICQLKALCLTQAQNVQKLRFADNTTPSNIVLVESSSPTLTSFTPDNNYIDKFQILQFKNLRFGRSNEQLVGSHDELIAFNLIYQVQVDYVLVYNQLRINANWRHYIFFYQLIKEDQAQKTETFAKHVLSLPLFEDSRYLAYIHLVQIEEKKSIQRSFILAVFQLPSGIEIVQSLFENSSAINRKFLYLDINFCSFISSNINERTIELKGNQKCLEQHAITIQSADIITQQTSIVLLSLPSTSVPKESNRLFLPTNSYCLRSTNSELWMATQSRLICIRKKSKIELYRSMMNATVNFGDSILRYAAKEVQFLLEGL